MFQKLIIKLVPYIIIVVLVIGGWLYISHLNEKIDELNVHIGSKDEIINQLNETIKEKDKDAQTAQKEQEKDKEEHQQASQELITYNQKIENFVNNSQDLINELNKYNECIAKNFNNNTDCSEYLKVGE